MKPKLACADFTFPLLAHDKVLDLIAMLEFKGADIGLLDREIEPLVQRASHFHVRGGRKGRLQERFSHNTIDYQRVAKVMQKTGYRGWLGIEYVWIDWEHCNECDNVSETVQFRDFFISSMK